MVNSLSHLLKSGDVQGLAGVAVGASAVEVETGLHVMLVETVQGLFCPCAYRGLPS